VSHTVADLSSQPGTGPRTLRVGLHAEPQLRNLAKRIVDDLREELERRFPGIEWRVELGEGGPKNPQARIAELVQDARRLLLDKHWDLVICLTDIPLRSDDHRPLTAIASATDGVGLISVPALGAIALEVRVREAALDLIAALVGWNDENRESVRDRLHELASPMGMAQVDDNTIRFSTAVMRGNLRLLIGMVRANHPWRVTVKLSRALVAALGTAAYVLASSGFWILASYMTWPRLLGLALAALVTTSVALIAAHNLWEHSADSHTRERVVLFNVVTALTIAIGVLTLYLALLAFSVVGSFSLIPEGALNAQIHRAAAGDYLRLAWMATSLATLAGALGSLVESDLAVREAAYGYRPSQEAGDDGTAAGEQGGCDLPERRR
jgi:putative flippase GtrA